MTRMAICAGNLIGIVIIAMPAEAGVVSVAIDTKAVLRTDRCRGLGTEQRIGGGSFLAASDPAGMIAGGTVAGLALQLTMPERPIWIRRVCMRTLK